MTDRIRHAVVRFTGATTLARKTEQSWTVQCLNHSTSAPVEESRGKAWTLASHPQDRCAKCGQIAKGKAPKITDGRLDLPKAPAKKTAAKPAAKCTTKKAPARPTAQESTPASGPPAGPRPRTCRDGPV